MRSAHRPQRLSAVKGAEGIRQAIINPRPIARLIGTSVRPPKKFDSEAFLEKFKSDEWVILPRPLDADLVAAALKHAASVKNWDPILKFETTGQPEIEYGRWQKLIPDESKLIKIRGKKPATVRDAVIRDLNYYVRYYLGLDYLLYDPVYLKSASGGTDQVLHRDFTSAKWWNKEKFAFSVVVALGADGARIKIEENQYINIGPRQILVFHGKLWHAGCAYDKTNYRIHAYFRPPTWRKPKQVVQVKPKKQ